MLNNRGLSMQPCLTPTLIGNDSVKVAPIEKSQFWTFCS